MAEKYIKNSNGTLTEVEGLVISSGAGDAGKIPALDTSGRMDTSMMPVGMGADTISIVAYEALAAGDFVNIFDDSGTVKARKAIANTTGKEANGFVLSSVSIGASATVYFAGTNTALSGLTIGAQYFLSSSAAGAITATAPTTSGGIVQKVGRAASATSINFQPSDYIVLA